MRYQTLIDYVQEYITLSEADIEDLKSLTRYKEVRKGQYIVEQGNVCYYENFVLEGCLRCYKLDESGQEHIIQFAVEDWWISDLQSFLTQSPANLSVDAIEASKLIQFGYSELQELYSRVPKFERFFRVIIQNAFIASQHRLLETFSKDAGLRYIDFRNRYPNIEKRVPKYMVASYLGITPEFLSKIRKRTTID